MAMTPDLLMFLDHHVTLGRFELRVSAFVIGTMTFGGDLGAGEETRVLSASAGERVQASDELGAVA
jgi:aryl-alcohol dehydrogenase-like predicted oxidoreductase